MSLFDLRLRGQVRRPPICGSASANSMIFVAVSSTTDLAVASAALLWSMLVCDLTLLLYVFYPNCSLLRRRVSVSNKCSA